MVQRYTLGSHGYIRLCCRSLCRFPDQIWFQYRTGSENYAGKSIALALHSSPDDQNRLIPCITWNNWLITFLIPLQSIGFIGPGVSLLCLRFAQTPSVAAVLMTTALSLSSFSQAGYFCNIQVVFPSCPDQWSHTTSIPWTIFSLSRVLATSITPLLQSDWMCFPCFEQDIAPKYAGSLHGMFSNMPWISVFITAVLRLCMWHNLVPPLEQVWRTA